MAVVAEDRDEKMYIGGLREVKHEGSDLPMFIPNGPKRKHWGSKTFITKSELIKQRKRQKANRKAGRR